VTLVVVAIQHLSARVLREHPYRWGTWHGLTYYLAGLSQYDGPRYIDIAQHGYHYQHGVQSTIVWFPLYPLLVRAVSHLGVQPIPAGILVTVLGGAATLVLWWTWLGARGIEGSARIASFFCFALYPYSWYLYGVTYADAVFLTFAIGAFVLVETDHLVLAGFVGAAATATRPTGMTLVLALFAVALERRGALVARAANDATRAGGWSPPALAGRFAAWIRWPAGLDRSKLHASSFAPLLSAVGVCAYAGYLWARFGSPIIFITNQSTFHGGRYPLLKGTFLNRVVHFPEATTYTLTITLQAILMVGALLLVGRVARRFGFGYGLLVLSVFTFAWTGSHDFQGTGRYLLGAFPLFGVAGEWLAERPKAVRPVIAASGALMLVMAFGFSRGAYLA
jgi:hypothetical protein